MATSAPDFQLPLTSEDIQKILPHRAPFLMVDRVLELGKGRIKCVKAVGQNEPWFPGHFPGRPIMPGVLMIEALAQAGAIMVLMDPEHFGKLALLASVANMRFRRVVEPGEVMDIEVQVGAIRRSIGLAEGTVTVAGELAAKGELKFGLQGT